jgi:hypothetical protein
VVNGVIEIGQQCFMKGRPCHRDLSTDVERALTYSTDVEKAGEVITHRHPVFRRRSTPGAGIVRNDCGCLFFWQ